MTLHLAASISYDCGIIAYSLLIFSFLMRGFFGEEGSIGGKELSAYCVVAVLLAPCKVIYSCICILGLLIPTSKFTSKKFAYLSKGASCVAIVVAVCVTRLASISTLAVGSDISHRGTETGHFYTVAEIIQHPLHSFRVLFRSFDQLGDIWLGSMIGNSLGWFQGEITVPYFFMVPYLGMGALCCFESHDEDVCLAKKTSAWFVVAFVLVFLGAAFSMWIGWTFNTEDVVNGVQGRYLLPALPMLLFALRSNRLVYKGQAFRCILCGMSIMNLIYLVRLFSIVMSI